MFGLIVINQNSQHFKPIPFWAACCCIQATVNFLKGKVVISFVADGLDRLHGGECYFAFGELQIAVLTSACHVLIGRGSSAMRGMHQSEPLAAQQSLLA
jgi:hypothetical protein